MNNNPNYQQGTPVSGAFDPQTGMPVYQQGTPVQQWQAPNYAAPVQPVPVQVPVQQPIAQQPAVQPIPMQQVPMQGIPVQQVPMQPMYVPVPLTEEQLRQQAVSNMRKESGRVGGVLMVGQLVASIALYIVLIAAIVIMMIATAASQGVDAMLNTFTDPSAVMGITFLSLAIAQLLGNVVPFIPYAKKRGISSNNLFFGGTKAGGKLFWGTALVGIGLNSLWGYVYMLICEFLPQAENSGFALDIPLDDPLALCSYIALVCIIAPITEEYMFRGVLMMSMSRYGVRFALIVTSVFFGLLHGNIAQTPMAVLLGLALGYIALKTGSIKYSILIHFLNNTWATAFTLLYEFFPQYTTILDWVSHITSIAFIIGMIIVFIAARKKIDFPKDSEEVKAGPVKHRYWHFFTAGWNICFILMMVFTIAMTLVSSSMDMSALYETMDSYMQEVPAAIAGIIG